MADVIVGANYSTTLGVVRSVGLAGYGVRLLATNNACGEIAGKSKYVTKMATASLDFGEIYCGLEQLCGNDERILVIPTQDRSCVLLDQHFDLLKEHYYTPNIHQLTGEVTRLMDKLEQKNIAADCGLATAEGNAYVTDRTGIDVALCAAKYPCIIKPIASAKCDASKTLITVCSNRDELESGMLRAKEQGCERVLLERFLSGGKDYAAYGVAVDGEVYIPAFIDTWRSGFGGHKGVTAEGAVLDAERFGEVTERLKNFVARIGLTGLFCIDLIECDGTMYFVEMNMRYGASGYAVTAAGTNLPGLFADACIRGNKPDAPMLRSEVTFLSEKVELDAYCDGFLSRKDYMSAKPGERCFFMKNTEDPGPWLAFRRYKRKRLIRTSIKKMLSCLGLLDTVNRM